MSESKYSIELKGVSKKFGDVFALSPLDLSIYQGEFLTLLGPSGSGKSTLLNLIAGAYSASSGTICLNGYDITTAPPRKRGIGMVFQNYALMPHMSVFDNVAYPLRIRHQAKADIEKKVMDALERVGLSGFEKRKPRQLSGGQQQRVGIARCIVYSPSIIMMDEPLGALDKNLREQMQEEIRHLHQQLGITFIYVTHDQEEALNMSDRICLMHNGGISQIGTPDELYFLPQNRFAAEFIGDANLLSGHIRHKGRFVERRGIEMNIPDDWSRRDEAVEILVRPEKIHLSQTLPPDEGINTSCPLQGRITELAFTGNMTRVRIKAENDLFILAKIVSGRGHGGFRKNDPVHIVWDINDMVLLGNNGN